MKRLESMHYFWKNSAVLNYDTNEVVSNKIHMSYIENIKIMKGLKNDFEAIALLEKTYNCELIYANDDVYKINFN